MLPPAPARFSTTNCWPRLSLSFTPTILAMMSTGPPGAKGTMTRTGLLGHAWAWQAPANAHAASATESLLLISVILSPPMRRDSGCAKVAARNFPQKNFNDWKRESHARPQTQQTGSSRCRGEIQELGQVGSQ